MTPLCFLDTETDGLHPDRKAWEIAVIRRDDTGQRELSFFVDLDLGTADLAGLKIGGFYDRHPVGRWLNGPDDDNPLKTSHRPDAYDNSHDMVKPWDAAEIVARWTHGAHIVGAVPSFDTECLAKLLREHDLVPAWHHRLRCVESLTVGHLGREMGGLAACALALGIEHPDAHTALGDARTAMAIWDRVMSPASAVEREASA